MDIPKNIKSKNKENSKTYTDKYLNMPDQSWIDVPNDKVFYVPISGGFFKDIRALLQFLFNVYENEKDLMLDLEKCKEFHKVDPKEYTLQNIALNTVISLLSECNHQAIQQEQADLSNDSPVMDELKDIIDKEADSIDDDNKNEEVKVKPNEEIKIEPSSGEIKIEPNED